jgi:hypothetical protein
MTTCSRSQAENALAALVNAIRPDWSTPGILRFLRVHPTRPLDQLAAAALWATTRRDQTSPHLIAEDDGEALDRLTGKHAGPPTPSPTRGCPYHAGQPKECPTCAAERLRAAGPDRAQAHIATIRQAIRNNRQEQE